MVNVFLWMLFGIACLIFLYFFLLTPRHRRPEAEPLMRTAYAHRGLWDKTHPENSLAAFRAATEAGFGIELDVQLTRDGELVVFHDASLARVTGAEGKVYEKDLAELRALTLGKSEEYIPTFAEVLALVAGRVPLLVEIKSDYNWRGVCEKTAELLDGYGGEYLIESFHPLAVAWFRKHRPSVLRGQLSARLWKERQFRTLSHFLVQNLLLNFYARPDFIAYDVHDRGVLSFRLSRLFHPFTLAWTIRTPEEHRQAKGFDGVIFEVGALEAVSAEYGERKEETEHDA